MNLGAKPDRNTEIVRRYREGETMEAIGDDYGISRERVRVILARAGVESRGRKDYRGPRVAWTCEQCGREREAVPSQVRRFCSRACAGAAKRADDDDLLVALQGLALRLGRTPSEEDMNADPSTPCHTTYVYRFGSLREAQERAGLTPNRVGHDNAPLPDWLIE